MSETPWQDLPREARIKIAKDMLDKVGVESDAEGRPIIPEKLVSKYKVSKIVISIGMSPNLVEDIDNFCRDVSWSRSLFFEFASIAQLNHGQLSKWSKEMREYQRNMMLRMLQDERDANLWREHMRQRRVYQLKKSAKVEVVSQT